uniref:Uncharacterized protein n=1 Tax=Plectus sambesii TaxID=2011161 RepID=A0A914XAE9_9BILA
MQLAWLLVALLALIAISNVTAARGRVRKRRQAGCSSTSTSGSLSALYLLNAGNASTVSYRHALTTVNAASGWNYESTLAATALTDIPADCPSSCLQLLTLYQHTVPDKLFGGATVIDYVDAFSTADEDFLKFQGYTTTSRPSGSNTIYCAPVKGACGATVPIYRHFEMLKYFDHFISISSTTSLGYSLDNLALPICYLWSTTTTATTTQASVTTTTASATVAGTVVSTTVAATVATTTAAGTASTTTATCLGSLTAFNRYDLATTNAGLRGLHDKYDTTLSQSQVPSGYNYETTHGCVLTSKIGCDCPLVQLHVYYGENPWVKNFITSVTTDPMNLPLGYVENTTQTMYCVPASSGSGTCGATMLLQRYYNALDVDHALGVESDTTLTSLQYTTDFMVPDAVNQCYVWDTSTCTVTATAGISDCTTYLSAFYRYDLPTTNILLPWLHDKYDTALSLSEVPSGYNYDTVHGCVLTSNIGCSCTLIQLHVYYVVNILNVKNYITTITTDPLTWGYTEDTSQSLWCVPATSPSGTCGATKLLLRYYSAADVDHALGVESVSSLDANYGPDLLGLGGSQCYIWDASQCTTVSSPTPSPSTIAATGTVTSTASDCTTYLSAFYRYDLPTTNVLLPWLHDKYDTALSLSAVPSGYNYDTVHGCVLTSNIGCSCSLIQLHVYYVVNILNVKNYITTITTDPLTWGYTEDTSQSLWCVPATSPSGTCGATKLLLRYYSAADVDHALGVESDSTLNLNYGPDLIVFGVGGPQCYVWDASMCTVTTATTTPSSITTGATVTTAATACTTNLSPFYRYDLPTTDPTMPGLHDKYDTALSVTEVPLGYNYETTHGCVLTDPTGCNCPLVQLHVYYKYDTINNIKNYITTTSTDPLNQNYTEVTDESLWCVPYTSANGTCGATVLLRRYYNSADSDSALGSDCDASLTSNGYALDDWGGENQCYIWSSSMCSASTATASSTTTVVVTAATSTTTAASTTTAECTALSAFYRYDLPTPNATALPGYHDKYDTTLGLSRIPAGYNFDTVHGCILTSNIGCSCSLIQLHVYHINDTKYKVLNYITTKEVDPLTQGYTEDTSQTLWCVPATSPSGTCGATVLLQRYYNNIQTDHALGFQSDTSLTTIGYVLDFWGGVNHDDNRGNNDDWGSDDNRSSDDNWGSNIYDCSDDNRSSNDDNWGSNIYYCSDDNCCRNDDCCHDNDCRSNDDHCCSNDDWGSDDSRSNNDNWVSYIYYCSDDNCCGNDDCCHDNDDNCCSNDDNCRRNDDCCHDNDCRSNDDCCHDDHCRSNDDHCRSNDDHCRSDYDILIGRYRLKQSY